MPRRMPPEDLARMLQLAAAGVGAAKIRRLVPRALTGQPYDISRVQELTREARREFAARLLANVPESRGDEQYPTATE